MEVVFIENPKMTRDCIVRMTKTGVFTVNKPMCKLLKIKDEKIDAVQFALYKDALLIGTCPVKHTKAFPGSCKQHTGYHFSSMYLRSRIIEAYNLPEGASYFAFVATEKDQLMINGTPMYRLNLLPSN